MCSYNYDEPVTVLWVDPKQGGAAQKQDHKLADAVRMIVEDWAGEDKQLTSVVLTQGVPLQTQAQVLAIYNRADFPKG